MRHLTFYVSVVLRGVTRFEGEYCTFNGTTSGVAGGLGVLNNGEQNVFAGDMDVRLWRCSASFNSEDGFQFLNYEGSIYIDATLCYFTNNADDCFELEENKPVGEHGIWGSMWFCDASSPGQDPLKEGACYNFSEAGAGDLNVNMYMCSANDADDTNIEYKESGNGHIDASLSYIDIDGNDEGEGIELRELGLGRVLASIDYTNIDNTETQCLQIKAEYSGNPGVNSLYFDHLNVSQSRESHNIELDIGESGTLSVLGYSSTSSDSNKDGLKITKSSGNIPHLSLSDWTFLGNGQEDVDARLMSSSGTMYSSFSSCSTTEGIKLSVTHDQTLTSSFLVTGSAALYGGTFSVSPITPVPNYPQSYYYWSLNTLARQLLGLQ